MSQSVPAGMLCSGAGFQRRSISSSTTKPRSSSCRAASRSSAVSAGSCRPARAKSGSAHRCQRRCPHSPTPTPCPDPLHDSVNMHITRTRTHASTYTCPNSHTTCACERTHARARTRLPPRNTRTRARIVRECRRTVSPMPGTPAATGTAPRCRPQCVAVQSACVRRCGQCFESSGYLAATPPALLTCASHRCALHGAALHCSGTHTVAPAVTAASRRCARDGLTRVLGQAS
jgi:hypothetical protein